ncbi:MAG: hypothetical protein CVV16_16240, partial [Gammaproteobacteria bacterium HGW-Gammaproteobacteria-6]
MYLLLAAPLPALADTAERTISIGLEWLLALLALLISSLVMLRWSAHRALREQRSEHSSELIEREERLSLALWGSGDEFWDWDIARNELFRIGADR